MFVTEKKAKLIKYSLKLTLKIKDVFWLWSLSFINFIFAFRFPYNKIIVTFSGNNFYQQAITYTWAVPLYFITFSNFHLANVYLYVWCST